MWATWRSRSVGRRSTPSGVDDVLTVGPGLHQPRRDERAGAHRRAVPRHPRAWGRPCAALVDRAARRSVAPPVEQLGHGEASGPAATDGSGRRRRRHASSAAASAANARGRSAPAAPAGRRTRGGSVWSPTLQPGAGVGTAGRHPATIASRSSCSAVEVVTEGVHDRIIVDAGHAGIGGRQRVARLTTRLAGASLGGGLPGGPPGLRPRAFLAGARLAGAFFAGARLAVGRLLRRSALRRRLLGRRLPSPRLLGGRRLLRRRLLRGVLPQPSWPRASSPRPSSSSLRLLGRCLLRRRLLGRRLLRRAGLLRGPCHFLLVG